MFIRCLSAYKTEPRSHLSFQFLTFSQWNGHQRCWLQTTKLTSIFHWAVSHAYTPIFIYFICVRVCVCSCDGGLYFSILKTYFICHTIPTFTECTIRINEKIILSINIYRRQTWWGKENWYCGLKSEMHTHTQSKGAERNNLRPHYRNFEYVHTFINCRLQSNANEQANTLARKLVTLKINLVALHGHRTTYAL